MNLPSGVTIVLDTETTNLPSFRAPNPFYNVAMVDMAFIVVDNTTQNVLYTFSSIVNPSPFKITRDSYLKHGITEKRAQDEGIAPRRCLEKLMEVVNRELQSPSRSVTLVCHNVDFDLNVLTEEMRRCGMFEDIKTLKSLKTFCTMKNGTDVCKLPSPNGFDGYKYPKLEELYFEMFKEKPKESHRALADCESCLRVFRKMWMKGESVSGESVRGESVSKEISKELGAIGKILEDVEKAVNNKRLKDDDVRYRDDDL